MLSLSRMGSLAMVGTCLAASASAAHAASGQAPRLTLNGTAMTTTSTSIVTSSSTTSTVPGVVRLLAGKKLLVKQKQSGLQRLQLLAKSSEVTVDTPCETAGEIRIVGEGAGGFERSIPLEAAGWTAISRKKPERGCKYRKGDVAATVLLKAGKLLKVITKSTDLGFPLDAEPRPVRIEVRHGEMRHCLRFDVDDKGKFRAGKVLLSKKAARADQCPDAQASGAKIVVLSQSAIVLSAQGEQSTIVAQVQSGDGHVDESAVINFASSNPDSVQAGSDGRVTALNDLGSAVITLSSAGVMPVAVTVIVAQPNDRALFIDDADVLSAVTDQSQIVLHTSPAILDLEVGDVVISGDQGGVFAYILAIEQQGDTVVIQGRLARLAEVFDELDLDLIGPSVPIPASLGDSTLTIHSKSGQVVQEAFLDRIECEADASGAQVSLSDVAITVDGLDRLNPRVRYLEHFDLDAPGCDPVFPFDCVVVDEFALSIDAKARAAITFGQLSIGGGLSAAVECKVDLGTYSIVPIPLLGPLIIAGSVTPDVTVTVGGSYNGASLTIKGPTLDKSVELMAGFTFSLDGGFATVGSGEPTFSGPGLTWVDATAEIENDLSLSIEPALNVTPGISLLVGTNALRTFDLFTLSFFGGAEVTLNTPLSRLDLDYKGPRWELYFGGKADLSPLLENFQGVGEFLDSFGLKEEADQLFDLELILFQLKVTAAQGPEPTVSADVVGSTRSVDLTASAASGLDDGTMVTFYAAEQAGGGFGSLEEIADTTVQGGVATASWEPAGGGTDVYAVSVRVESIFGDDLPYGPAKNAQVSLEGGITLEPESLAVTLRVGESRDETVTVVSQGLAADYEVVNSQPHVTIGNPQGSVEADGMVDLSLTVTCPQEAGSYPQSFDLLFTDQDGVPIEQGVPEALSVVVICEAATPDVAFRTQYYSAANRFFLLGPENSNAEAYASDDVAGTGKYQTLDIVDGVGGVVETDIPALGFADVSVSRSLSATKTENCGDNAATVSGTATTTTSASVNGSVVTFTGALISSFTKTPSVCGSQTNEVSTVARFTFDLWKPATLAANFTCDGTFLPSSGIGRGLLELKRGNETIFNNHTPGCEVNVPIPAGRYEFLASNRNINGNAQIGGEGGNLTLVGNYEMTITINP